jgi:hypothetical protein
MWFDPLSDGPLLTVMQAGESGDMTCIECNDVIEQIAATSLNTSSRNSVLPRALAVGLGA